MVAQRNALNLESNIVYEFPLLSGEPFFDKAIWPHWWKKIHMQSLGAMAHISYKEPRLCSYEMAAGYMREINLLFKQLKIYGNILL